jgi:hypothetical protein
MRWLRCSASIRNPDATNTEGEEIMAADERR